MRKALRRVLSVCTAALTALLPAPAAHAESFDFLANAVSRLDAQLNRPNGGAGCYDVVIESVYLGLYVSAEQNTADYPGTESGALRARTAYDKIGPWEIFHLCSHDGGFYTLPPSPTA